MAFNDYEALARFMSTLGAERAIYKRLSENDNSKQQIYMGGDFSFLTEIPMGEITEYAEVLRPNFKAPVELWWIDDNGDTAPAEEAQLILYPKYPEVRLSGFMRGCQTAPKGHMNPVPAGERVHRNGKDGRILFLGITPKGRIYAYLATKNSAIALSFPEEGFPDEKAEGTLLRFPLHKKTDNSRDELIARLSNIVQTGWIESCRMDAEGNIIKYTAQNAGGYTLEALFGIIPNGRAEPDFCEWELKVLTKNRITLMTPEPDGGFYKLHGAKEFALRYGHDSPQAFKYFSGTHKAGKRNATTSMTMKIKGFDPEKNIITDVNGGIVLVPPDGSDAAIWSFSLMMNHWRRKHAHTCYIKCSPEEQNGKQGYIFKSPVWLGEGTDFILFLQALSAGKIVCDPGTKVELTENGKMRVKARSQFRMNFNYLGCLYNRFEEHKL